MTNKYQNINYKNKTVIANSQYDEYFYSDY